MLQRRFSAILGSLLTLTILFVAITSKIPTSHCRCHESKKEAPKNDTKECPFKQLRNIVASSLLPNAIIIETPVRFEEQQSFPEKQIAFAVVREAANARAPPAQRI